MGSRRLYESAGDERHQRDDHPGFVFANVDNMQVDVSIALTLQSDLRAVLAAQILTVRRDRD